MSDESTMGQIGFGVLLYSSSSARVVKAKLVLLYVLYACEMQNGRSILVGIVGLLRSTVTAYV